MQKVKQPTTSAPENLHIHKWRLLNSVLLLFLVASLFLFINLNFQTLGTAQTVRASASASSTLVLTQDNTQVTATGTGLSGFKHRSGGSAETAACTGNYTDGATKSNLSHNEWVCFQATDTNNSTVSANLRVNLTKPVVSVTQDTNSVDATATMAGAPTINATSWENFKQTDQPACDGSDTGITWVTTSPANTVAIVATDNDKWVCFKVKNSLGVYGYARYQIDTAPKIIISQNHNVVEAKVGSALLAAGDDYGYSIAIDGNYMVVGARDDSGHSGRRTGAVYIYKHMGTAWLLQQEISDREAGFTVLQPLDRFGWDVDLDGDWLAVGAPGDDGFSGFNTGAVYIFKQEGSRWLFKSKIYDQETGFTELTEGGSFGKALSLDGTRLAVGAHDDDDGGTARGAVYILKRSTETTWVLEKEFSNRSTDFTVLKDLDYFGGSVSLDGDRLAVGAAGDDGNSGDSTGAVYVFKRTGTSWALEKSIVDEASGFTVLEKDDYFGESVSLDGNYLAVGARSDDGHSGSNTGAVYVIKRTGTNWGTPYEISDKSTGFTTLEKDDEFGLSVTLDGEYLAVGAHQDDGHGGSDTGAVYIFKRTNETWGTPDEISDKSTGFTSLVKWDYFGWDVSLDGDNLAVGAPVSREMEPINDTGGTAYIFNRSNTTWSVDTKFEDQTATIKLNSWQNFKSTNNTDAPDCDSEDTFNTAGSNQNSVTITSADDNKWVCFRIKDSSDIYGYGLHRVSFTAPTMSITQTTSRVAAEAQPPSGLTITAWANSGLITSDPDCPNYSSDNYSVAPGADSLPLTSSDGGKYVCFRAKTSANVYGYIEHRIDLTDPTVSISQNDRTLQASSSDTGLPTAQQKWKKSGALTAATCSTATYVDGSRVTDAENGKYYCFKVKDKYGNEGVGNIQVNLAQPGLTLTQNDDKITAASSDTNVTLTGFEYFSQSGDPDCDGDDTYTGTGATTTSITHNHYVCFKAKNSLGVYGFAELRINRTQPGLTLTQNDDKITAASSDTNVTLTGFEYFSQSGDPDCDGDDTYTGTGTTTGSITHNHYVCFKAKNSLGVYGFAELRINRTQPGLTLTQNDDKITAASSDTNVTLTGFEYFSQSGDPDCDGDDTYTGTGTTTGSITHNHYVCFKAKNSLGVYGFAELRINRTQPGLTLTQNDDKITAASSDTNVTLTGFEYFSQSGDPDCDGDDTYTGTGTTTGSITHNHYVCFKAKNSLGVYGFAELRINRTQPGLTLTQNDDKITAVSSDTNVTLTGFEYFSQSGDPDCDGDDTYTGTGTTTGSITHNHYVCFKAKNSLGVYGFAELRINRTQPGLTLTQNDDKITAVSSDTNVTLTGFEYFSQSGDPDCDGDDTYTGTGTTTGSITHNHYVCFKAKNSLGVYGFAELRINRTQPGLTLTQNDDKITAASSDTNVTLTGFEYFSQSGDPDCDGDDTYTGTGTTTGSITHNHYVCFKAKNSLGVYGFAELRINRTQPTITLTQNNHSVTASGTGLSGYEYFISSSNPDCDGDDTYTGTGQTTTSITSSHWVCFKAKNNLGVYGFEELQVFVSVPPPPTTTIPPQPVITLTQDDKSVSATGENLSDFAYFKSARDPACDKNNQTSTYVSGSTASDLGHGQWVCFKAKNSSNVWGYAELQVDLSKPILAIKQLDKSLLASVSSSKFTTVSGSWQNFVKEDAEPDCDADDIFSSSSANNNRLSIDSSSSDQWACFRVKNIRGVWGYAKHQIVLSSDSEVDGDEVGSDGEDEDTDIDFGQPTPDDSPSTLDDSYSVESSGGRSSRQPLEEDADLEPETDSPEASSENDSTTPSDDEREETEPIDQSCRWWLTGIADSSEGQCLKVTPFDYSVLILLLIWLLLMLFWRRRKPGEEDEGK